MADPVAIFHSVRGEDNFGGLLLRDVPEEQEREGSEGHFSVYALRLARDFYQEVYGSRDPDVAIQEVLDGLRLVARKAIDGQLLVEVTEYVPLGVFEVLAKWEIIVSSTAFAEEGKEICIRSGEPHAEVFRQLPRES